MSEPFLSEIRIFSFNFPPKGWALCNGQLLPINQNTALFSLLGTTYGGNGQTNFALPDLRRSTPMHTSSHILGEQVSIGGSKGDPGHSMEVTTSFLALNFCIALEGIFPSPT